MRILLYLSLSLCLILITTCENQPEQDKTPPTIIITSPQEGSIVSGIVTISCEALDNEGIDKVELWVDGLFTNVSDSTDPYSFEWDTTPYESGSSHIITVKAFDTNGNVTVSDSISLFTFITFVKTFSGGNNRGNSVQQTNDGGYITVGYTDAKGSGQKDVWVIKTDSYGNLVWEKTFGGEFNDEGNYICQTGDGGYIITGSTERLDWPYSNQRFLWLLKTDSNGDTLWTKTYAHSSGYTGYSYGNSVQQTFDGGYIITGYGSTCVLLKTDAQGDTLWTKTFSGAPQESIIGRSVIQVTDGGYVFIREVHVSGTGNYFQIIKTDSEGNVIWLEEFGGVSDVDGYSVKQTSDDGYIITGGTSPGGAMYWDLILIKIDSQGNTIWNRTYGGGPTDIPSEIGYSVDQTNDGGYITAGFTSSNWDILLLKTDSEGDTVWTNTFTWGDYPIISEGKSVHVTIDGGFIVTGYTKHSQSQSDLILIKTDSKGKTVPYGD